ncbi:MAG: beta-ketoacyl-ACP synthase III, partial [Pseudomonadota bacterium]
WLHQANKTMNDYIGKKVLGRDPAPHEQPAPNEHNMPMSPAARSSENFANAMTEPADDIGILCSFGAGYSVGSAVLQKV